MDNENCSYHVGVCLVREHCELWSCVLWGWRKFKEKMQCRRLLHLSIISFDLKCISFHVSQSLLAESDGLRCFTNQFHSSQPDDMQKMCLAAENQKEHLILTKWFKPIWWNLAYGLQWIEYLWAICNFSELLANLVDLL